MKDIVENIDAVQSYSQGLTMGEAPQGDRMRRQAIERALQCICEAAAKLGDGAHELVPGQPWNQIRAFGNILRHEYDDFDLHYIWRVIQEDLPSLRRDCAAAILRFPHDP